MAKPTELNATLTRLDQVAPGLFVIDVTPDGELFDFAAGQYTTLGLPGTAPRLADAKPEREPATPEKMLKRAYSIASPPSRRDAVELYINNVDDGVFTPRLFALPVGGRLWMSARATGTFTLEGIRPNEDVLLVSTGTGVAPFMAMLRGPFHDAGEQRWVLIHGVRYVRDLGYRAELEALAARHPNFVYLPSVTRPEQTWSGHTGRVQQLFQSGEVERALGRRIDAERTHIFLCGNPDMIAAMEGSLGTAGFTVHKRHAPGRLHIESYW